MFWPMLGSIVIGKLLMPIEEVIAGKIISIIVDRCISSLVKLVPDFDEDRDKVTKELETSLSLQLTKARTFCESIEALRHEDRRAISENTISLSIHGTTRQSFQSLDDSIRISENDLLLRERSQLILGDPGAGKTTTLKRLVYEAFRLLAEEDEESFPYSYPLVFKLAELQPEECLYTYLANNLGISFDTIVKTNTYEVTEEYEEHDPGNEFANEDGNVIKYKTVKKTKTEYEYKIGGLPLESAMSSLLNEQSIIIFLDGLDEIHYKIRNRVFVEIKNLLSRLDSSKLIITSRYFEDVNSFKNISKNEILPLSEVESLSIINQWINDSPVFWGKLEGKPYKELATRPLFLFYLVMLYKSNKGVLPEQGVDVYSQVVLLVLREWDEQKEYKAFRYSKLVEFDTYKKEAFIAHLAFFLAFDLGVKRIFKRSDLIKAYANIYKKYPQLNASDAENVIKDIETDNGLIITSYANEYEFSHLSLQEYLCAKHILSIPFSRKIYDYMSANPEPLALAVILSAEPSRWFAMLVLNNINERQCSRKLTPSIIYTFINRLKVEGAVFDEINIEFGMSILYLIFESASSTQVGHAFYKFLKNKIVLESTIQAVNKFKVTKKDSTHIHVKRKSEVYSDLFLSFPDVGKVPIYLWDAIERKTKVKC